MASPAGGLSPALLRAIAEPDFSCRPVGEPNPAERDALGRHPDFPAAMRAAARASVELHQGGRLLDLLVSDRARLLLTGLALYLHYAPLPDRPGAGLTLSRLQAIAAETGVCSRGRTAAVVGLMRWRGYLEPDGSPADRRERRLAPTDRLLALVEERWRRQLAAAGHVLPPARAAAGRTGEPGFVPAFAVAQARGFLDGFRPLAAAPELRLFADRDCGALVLFGLLADATPDPAGLLAGPISLSALARRFAVSRAHVAKLLGDAEAAGLLERRPVGAVLLRPALVAACTRFFATLFLFNAACARAVLDVLDRTAGNAAPPR